MIRNKTKKFFTAIIGIIMIISVFAVIAVVSQPAYAASGSITLDPTTYSSGTTVTVLANGGTFSASTVTFYLSSSSSLTSPTSVGSYTLSSGETSLSNAATRLSIPSETHGTYYIAASDDGGKTFTSAVQVTITALAPKITVSSPNSAGGTATISGSDFDPGSTINVYLNYASGTILMNNVASPTGSFSGSFGVPNYLTQSDNPFYVVAQEVSSSSPNYGITADASFTLDASIAVSQSDIAPSSSSSVTITGYGFSASATISANSISFTPASGSITGESNSAVTTSASGGFTVTATFVSSTASGPVSVSVTTSTSSSPTSFSNAFYVSSPNPSNLEFSFSVTPSYGSTYNVGDSVTATVYNFPASQTVLISLGGAEVGTISTDANGYGQLLSTIPAMPGGSYYPTASIPSTGFYVQGTKITISPYFELLDTSGTSMTATLSEFVPASATLVVEAYGLTPGTAYDAKDTIAASGGVYANKLVSSITVGTAGTSGIEPALNGTLIFRYVPDYAKTTATSTSATVSLTNNVNGYGGNNFGYKAIGSSTVSSPSSFTVMTPGNSQTLTATVLIPYGSTVYPGTSYYYNAYIGNDELSVKFSGMTATILYASGGTLSGTFTVPSLSGVYNVSLTYSGASPSSAVGTQYTVVSTTGTSASSGGLSVIPQTSGFEVAGYGYYLTPTLYYMTYSGISSGSSKSLTSGGFAALISPGNQPGGTYSVFTEVTSSSVNYFVYSSYSSVPTLTISSPSKTSTGQYKGPVGTDISISATGLNPFTYYNVYFGTKIVKSSPPETDGTGTLSASFDAPAMPSGIYNIAVTQAGQTTPSASIPFNLTANSNIALSTSSDYAFPGELVQFTVSDMGSVPSLPIGSASGTPAYYVMVELNNTPYQYVPAAYSTSGSGTFTGSFVMPNNASGTYYQLSFEGYESSISSYTASSTSGYVNVTASFGTTQNQFLELISGNGAFVTGITQTQIAQIEAGLNATLAVPVSQLNAAVSSLDGSIAHITTEFGNMTTTLKAINATLTSVNSGVATVKTTIGTINTSVSSINATLVSMNGSFVTISTTAGKLNTTLSALNITVSGIQGTTATIKSDLGTFTGSVTSVSDGIATIQTSLGTLKANVSGLNSKVTSVQNYGLILDIVIIALIAVTLGIALVSLLGTRDIRNRFGMK